MCLQRAKSDRCLEVLSTIWWIWSVNAIFLSIFSPKYGLQTLLQVNRTRLNPDQRTIIYYSSWRWTILGEFHVYYIFLIWDSSLLSSTESNAFLRPRSFYTFLGKYSLDISQHGRSHRFVWSTLNHQFFGCCNGNYPSAAEALIINILRHIWKMEAESSS